MAWTEKQRKAHSARMKERYAAKKMLAAITGDHDNMVSSPPHYTFGKFEVIDVLEDWFPKDPLLWQVGKYIARADHKGNTVQDLEKARFYLDRKINQLKEKRNASGS